MLREVLFVLIAIKSGAGTEQVEGILERVQFVNMYGQLRVHIHIQMVSAPYVVILQQQKNEHFYTAGKCLLSAV